MPVKMRHTYIVIVINNHIIKEILCQSLIVYCIKRSMNLVNLKEKKDTFANYIIIWYKEGIHNCSY